MGSTGATVVIVLLVVLGVCIFVWPVYVMIRRRRNGGVEPAHDDFAPWIDGEGTNWGPRIWGENGADYHTLVLDEVPGDPELKRRGDDRPSH